jgi:hypothetical protein
MSDEHPTGRPLSAERAVISSVLVLLGIVLHIVGGPGAAVKLGPAMRMR